MVKECKKYDAPLPSGLCKYEIHISLSLRHIMKQHAQSLSSQYFHTVIIAGSTQIHALQMYTCVFPHGRFGRWFDTL